MDLFHHEMLESSFFCCFCIPVDHFHLLLDFFPIKVVESNLTLTYTGHLHIADIINISGIFQDSRNIRSNISFSILHTKDHRAVLSCDINFFRIITEHDRKCIRSTDTDHRMIDRIYRSSLIFLIVVVNQFHGYFCICL